MCLFLKATTNLQMQVSHTLRKQNKRERKREREIAVFRRGTHYKACGRRAKLQKSAAELNSTGTSDTLKIAWLSQEREEDERVCGGALTMV